MACSAMAARYRSMKVDSVGGFDARGFLFTPVAIKLGVPFFMLRKGGKCRTRYGQGATKP